ncbi:PQQ-binding-like beta-propeller repeat protein [Nocardia yunnanensis]|uniref:outer membrane protein assembly factor BamB family protein n=1 Tax=Nocardia yunnanensis TaxID=2382165 RepID=UPI0013C4D602|nr:PQQ-binding-like beta-propeller repeat protein [Nocardia yunnanensis]
MPIPTLRERLPRRALTSAARAVFATTVLVGTMGCGSHDSRSDPSRPTVPNLKLDAVKALTLEPNDEFGVTSDAIYTVENGDVYGVDGHSGLKLWWIKSPVTPVDKDAIQVLDSGRVLLLGWTDHKGLTAYDAGTGLQMWHTDAEQWFEDDESTGQFIHRNPRTGEQTWSVDPATLGCATPLSEELPALFGTDVVDLTERPSLIDTAERPGVEVFRCATPGGTFAVGGLDRATGSTVWHREVPELGSFLRAAGQIAVVISGDTIETVNMTTGHSLGSRKGHPDKELRITQPDGAALVLDSSTLSEDKEMRLLEPDGTARWTVPLDPKREELQPLMNSAGNAIFAVMRQQADPDYRSWLLAYDPRSGKRSVVIGPGPTAAGEKPMLTMPLNLAHRTVHPAPWGILVAGPDNTYATIPVQH